MRQQRKEAVVSSDSNRTVIIIVAIVVALIALAKVFDAIREAEHAQGFVEGMDYSREP